MLLLAPSFTIPVSIAILASWLLYKYYLKAKPPYPPGPKGLPIIGSLLDIDNERPWITYGKWANQYGELSPQNG
jgi:hypothetical protein